MGTTFEPAGEDARIVCLVPSLTELLCALGLAERLVGRTGFCIHPREVVRTIPKVGGTIDVALERIRALAPTHVILSLEENRLPTAQALREFVDHVVVTHPRSPRDNLRLYRLLGGLFGRAAQAERLCAQFERAYASALAEPHRRREVLYLIWREPWMAAAAGTYIAGMLGLVGWRAHPLCAGDRYPVVDPAALAGEVDLVLLATEPYPFRPRHLKQVAALLPPTRVALVDGEMTSWYGSRAIQGLRYLAAFARRFEHD